jgi:hypothetical protein
MNPEYVSTVITSVLDNFMVMGADEECHLKSISNPSLSKSELTFAFYARIYGYGVATCQGRSKTRPVGGVKVGQ